MILVSAGTIAVIALAGVAAWSRYVESHGAAALTDVTAAQVAQMGLRSVVTVKVDQFRRGPGSGSGFLLFDADHVVTNAHVVAKPVSITVTDFRGDNAPLLLGSDVSYDIAELKLVGEKGTPLTIDPSPQAVGDPVFIVGNPFGDLPNSVTSGTVSGLGRSATVNGVSYNDLIQLDATAAPGNSGGPVLDRYGRVLGILTLGSASTHFTFAIPISAVLTELKGWISASPISIGPPMVTANASDLTISANDVPATWKVTKDEPRGANGWQRWLDLGPAAYGWLEIQSYVVITTSSDGAMKQTKTDHDVYISRGFNDVSPPPFMLGDATMALMHTGVHAGADYAEYAILWADRNVAVIFYMLGVPPGFVSPDGFQHLCETEESRISSNLVGTPYA